MRVHRTALRHPVVSTQNVESVETDGGRIGELTKVQTGEKACGTWRSHGSATSTGHSTKSETFCSETMSLEAREKTARKPVLRSARRVCTTTTRARSRDHLAMKAIIRPPTTSRPDRQRQPRSRSSLHQAHLQRCPTAHQRPRSKDGSDSIRGRSVSWE